MTIASTTIPVTSPCATIGNTGGLSCRQAIAEVVEHGPTIVRHQSPILVGRTFQDLRIAYAFESGESCREIDGWLAPSHRPDEVEVEIGVRLKANSRARVTQARK